MKPYTEESEIKMDVVEFKGCAFESDQFSFEATKIYKEDTKNLYDDLDIEVTDKRTKPWKEYLWDNNEFFLNVYNNIPDSMNTLIENLGERGSKEFRSFIIKLVEMKWLKIKTNTTIVYSKEQVMDVLSKPFNYSGNVSILNSLTPIELPSDEEIEAYFKKGYGGDDGSAIYGAKWVIEQIKNQ